MFWKRNDKNAVFAFRTNSLPKTKILTKKLWILTMGLLFEFYIRYCFLFCWAFRNYFASELHEIVYSYKWLKVFSGWHGLCSIESTTSSFYVHTAKPVWGLQKLLNFSKHYHSDWTVPLSDADCWTIFSDCLATLFDSNTAEQSLLRKILSLWPFASTNETILVH